MNIPTDEDLSYVPPSMTADLDVMLVYNLMLTHSRLAPFIDANLRRDRLSAAQFNTLLALRTAGENGLLMSEIGQRLVVTKSNVTGIVDRLEKQGLASRTVHTDRRAIVVRLTPAGAELLDQTIPQYAELLTDLTASLTGEEKATLVLLLTRLRKALRERKKEAV